MAIINSLNDFQAWLKARELNKQLFVLLNHPKYNPHQDLKNQILKSSRSVMANLAEGFARLGNKEFLNFISIAKGSLSELKSDIIICYDFELLNDQEMSQLLYKIDEIGKMANSLMNYLKSTKLKGTKFK